MTKAHLTLLWGWIGLAATILLLASVMTVQGGVNIFDIVVPADREKEGNAVVAYMAVAMGTPLFCLSLLLAILHARRHGTRWHSRIPVVMLDGLNTSSWEGKVFQILVAFILVVIPTIAITHCLRVANEGYICEQAANTPPPGRPVQVYPGENGTLFSLPAHSEQLRLVRDKEAASICKSGYGLDWYTWWLVVAFPVLAVALLAIWLAALLLPRSPRDTAPERPFHTP